MNERADELYRMFELEQNVVSVPGSNSDVQQLLPHVAVSEWLVMRPITDNVYSCALLR